MTVSIGTVFLLNAAALYLFPPLGHLLGLSPGQFGTWAGVGIHDISSVVGAASAFGSQSLEVATAVKLSRALWIIPMTLLVSMLARRFGDSAPAAQAPKIQIPYFIGLFLAAALVRTYIPAVAAVAPYLARAAVVGFTVTLFLVGAGISVQVLKRVGWRVLLQGLVLWLSVMAASLLVILSYPRTPLCTAPTTSCTALSATPHQRTTRAVLAETLPVSANGTRKASPAAYGRPKRIAGKGTLR